VAERWAEEGKVMSEGRLEVGKGNPRYPDYQKVVQLFAASPWPLEACKAAKDVLAEYQTKEGKRKVYEQLETAIAKAEGR